MNVGRSKGEEDRLELKVGVGAETMVLVETQQRVGTKWES